MKTLLLLSLCLAVPAIASNTYIPKTSQLPRDDNREEAREEETDRAPASEDSDTLRVKKRQGVNNDDGDENYIKR